MSGRTIKINNLEFNIKVEKTNSKYTYIKFNGNNIIIKTKFNNVDNIIPIIEKNLEKLELYSLPKEIFEELPIFGIPYKLIIKNIKRKYLIFHKKRLIILNPNYKEDFINYLSKLLIKYCSKEIKKFLKLLDININPEIEIKIMKSKYAYVKDNKIYLSIINVFFPKYLIDYILFHEVIHFKIKNHGYQFKKLLEMLYPNYKELEKELKKWTIAIFYNKNINNLLNI
ncbi:zinc metalloprotease [Nanoarchaeota archaeon]